MSKSVIVIDLGSNKLAAALARIEKDGEVSLIALENLTSRGISGGEITDMAKAIEDVSLILEKLQRQEKRKIKSVYATTKGEDVKMDTSRGMIALSRSPREVTERDVRKSLEISGLLKIPLDRAVLEKSVKGFSIDGGQADIKDPVGLYGVKLEAEAFIATCNQSKVQNIAKCIDHAGYLLNGVYLSSRTAANSILEES